MIRTTKTLKPEKRILLDKLKEHIDAKAQINSKWRNLRDALTEDDLLQIIGASYTVNGAIGKVQKVIDERWDAVTFVDHYINIAENKYGMKIEVPQT